jgi:hypothetical protein
VGDVGELTQIHINHTRNLITHLTNLTVGQRPAFEPQASNTDHKSQAQTLLARSILNFEMSEKELEAQLREAACYALTYGDSCITALWNAKQGDEVMRMVVDETGEEVYEVITDDNGNPVMSGDIEYRAVPAYDIIRDPGHESVHNQDWVVIRDYVNRYDLAATYANADDLAEDQFDSEEEYAMAVESIEEAYECIMGAPSKSASNKNKFNIFASGGTYDTDEVVVYYMFHKQTPAMPEGRMVIMVDEGKCSLQDGPLPYASIPVHIISPGQTTGTPLGYTPAFDILSLQQALDATHSTIITNQRAFGVHNIMYPQGSNISAPQISGGMNFIPYVPDVNGGKPETLQLLQTPAELFAYAQTLEQQMETLMGISEVVRGNAMDGNMSGTAMALSASTSIEFSQEFQQSYIKCLEDVGSSIIDIYQTYAEIPRTATIVGKSKAPLLKEWKRDDLAAVDRVTVDVGSPFANSTAGKVQIAQDMLNMELISTPEEYLMVVQTGNLDTLMEGDTSELMNIRAENEYFIRGEPVQTIVTDNHVLHIQEHKSVLASPDSRKDPMVLQATLDHINEHIAMLQNPAIAPLNALLGQPPMAPQQQPTVTDATAAAAETSQVLNNTNPILAAGQEVQPAGMPAMPDNPLTGGPVSEGLIPTQ